MQFPRNCNNYNNNYYNFFWKIKIELKSKITLEKIVYEAHARNLRILKFRKSVRADTTRQVYIRYRFYIRIF